MRDGDHWVAARVVADASPYGAWEQNLNLVTDVLAKAEVGYFCVPAINPLQSLVAVEESQRSKVLSALSAAGPDVVIRPRINRGRASDFIQVFRPLTNSTGSVVLGHEYACEIEFWRTTAGPLGQERLVGPRPNRTGNDISLKGEPAVVTASRLSPFAPSSVTLTYRARTEFAGVAPDDVTFPIDVVYTWVDGNDPDWRARKLQAMAEAGEIELNETAANASRYMNRDELRYSMRALYAYAPWVRRVFLVTDDQVPPWLDTSHPWITLVSHREIFGNTGKLPTFNSHAIESRLHRIPELAEHFLYFNDDVFLGRPTLPTTFFHANGIAKFFLSPAQIELGEPTIDDPPVTAAGKNNRAVILQRFGRTITQKMRHVPFALRRSVLEEIERERPDEVAATATHQFRHPKDLSIVSSLHHYWAFMTGRSVPDTIAYAYSNLSHPSTPVRLVNLLRHRDRTVFCLNDTDSQHESFPEQHQMLADFLELYFPFRAPFEVSVETEQERRGYSPTQLGKMLLGDRKAVA